MTCVHKEYSVPNCGLKTLHYAYKTTPSNQPSMADTAFCSGHLIWLNTGAW